MRVLRLMLAALMCLGVVAFPASQALADHTAMATPASQASPGPACPDDCCDDCPDFAQCQMGCAAAVLPDMLSGTLPTRSTPNQSAAIAPYRSATLPPATPPPRAAIQL